MIRVRRLDEPTSLGRWKGRWQRALGAATTERENARAISKYRHKEIKKTLVEMFHGKCAYCESKIRHVDYGDIEHFRPKSKPEFRNLVFEWENLFLACSVCNGPSFKGDRFPEAAEGGPPVNPCDDRPEEHLEFVFDTVTKLATVASKTVRGKTTVDLFGLNRSELREHRSRIIEKLFALSRFARTDPAARKLLEQAQEDAEEYAAFARSLPE